MFAPTLGRFDRTPRFTRRTALVAVVVAHGASPPAPTLSRFQAMRDRLRRTAGHFRTTTLSVANQAARATKRGIRQTRSHAEPLVDRKMVISVIGGGAVMQLLYTGPVAWLSRAVTFDWTQWLAWWGVLLATIPIAAFWHGIADWAKQTAENAADSVEEATDDADSE